jgi:hypothetical protein
MPTKTVSAMYGTGSRDNQQNASAVFLDQTWLQSSDMVADRIVLISGCGFGLVKERQNLP